ncbi:MAG: hypothetical protein U0003_05565 [Vampirovibrionales bacterium]
MQPLQSIAPRFGTFFITESRANQKDKSIYGFQYAQDGADEIWYQKQDQTPVLLKWNEKDSLPEWIQEASLAKKYPLAAANSIPELQDTRLKYYHREIFCVLLSTIVKNTIELNNKIFDMDQQIATNLANSKMTRWSVPLTVEANGPKGLFDAFIPKRQ